MALDIDEEYTTSRDFWLKFVRAASYDAHEAAERLLLHFETKLEIFGKSKLTSEITIEDLEKEEAELLSCGYKVCQCCRTPIAQADTLS